MQGVLDWLDSLQSTSLKRPALSFNSVPNCQPSVVRRLEMVENVAPSRRVQATLHEVANMRSLKKHKGEAKVLMYLW